MALASVATGDTVAAADVNQYKNALEGAATATFLLSAAATTHFQVKLADAAGSYTFKVLDSAGSAVATIDSDGNLTITGGFTPGTLTLPTASSPSQTAEGSIVWDSDDNILTVGDGASRKSFYPDSTTYKYKTASQDFTNTTTFADVTATSGNIAFAVAASTAYLIDIVLNVSSAGPVGSAGLKLAFTLPTGHSVGIVHVLSGIYYSNYDVTDGHYVFTTTNLAGTLGQGTVTSITSGTEWGGALTANTGAGIQSGTLHFRLFFVNGSTAGTVTLQAAQKTANATPTTISSAFATIERMSAAA